ncbi:BUD13 homolog [Anolis sagrei]|uniref:BUD13 homolog n=1 Tax=Anolis sagrei TaxID=38937 RepID=UPI003521E184
MAVAGLSKAEYLKRYLGGGGEEKEEGEEEGKKRRRRKKKKAEEEEKKGATLGRMRIVDDDDTSWKSVPVEQEDEDEEGDEGDMPVVAEFIDERPDEVKWMETFRTSNKWKLMGEPNEEEPQKSANSSEVAKQQKTAPFPDQSPPRRGRHDSPDGSPPRKGRHDSPDLSPPRRDRHMKPQSGASRNNDRPLDQDRREHFSEKDAARPKRQPSPDASAPWKKARHSDADLLPPRKQPAPRGDKAAPSPQRRQRHDSDSSSGSPSRRSQARAASDSDLSPPRPSLSPLQRRRQGSPSDLSPPRRKRRASSGSSDLSPPRRGQEAPRKGRRSGSPPDRSPQHRTEDAKGRGSGQRGPQMLSGGKAGLVSAELLRKEQKERRRQAGGSSKHLEADSQHAETVFRDKSGRKRDLQQERLELQKKAEEKSEREEQYAQWGKGLAQSRQQQQNVEDAVREMQKPLARYIDDQDLDKMLREQEREGDPMAGFLRKKKDKERKGAKEKPRYNGPAPPLNRFNIWPGHRWDGVDRSNGFEQKRFARIASKKAVQELAYKWSVEDM